ncbi:AAA family ATPase [Kordia jejudonensis]|uniref:AAA family ATPase n=1 Tax=Kordia jejudonensis TaxID=1348245 RepID=UPI0006291E37|nr:AAA family ATPase [Kordia jejudonensis]
MRIPKYDIPEIEQIPSFTKIMDDLLVGNNVFLVGSAGTFKSTISEKVSYAINGRGYEDGKELPYTIVNCNQWTSPTDIKGGQTMEGYKEGALIEAWRDGKILILDEMPKLDANTAGLLNDALAKSGKKDAIIFNGNNEPVKKHPHFGCIATGNTTGKGASANYVGNNRQDASLLDRFSGCIYHIGFNTDLENALIYNQVVTICHRIREEILNYEGKESTNDDTSDIMTLRTMANFQRNYELEMMREMGIRDTNGTIFERLKNGKTLKDAITNYFYVMNPDKAKIIMERVNIESFYNRYKSSENKQLFEMEYNMRNKQRAA